MFVVASMWSAESEGSKWSYGRVSWVDAKQVYLNRGADDGLTPGVKVEFRKRRRTIARCRVVAVSAHRAVCAAPAVRRASRFRYRPVRDATDGVEPVTSVGPGPAPIARTQKESARVMHVLQSANQTRIAASTNGLKRLLATPALRASGSLTHEAFFEVDSRGADIQRARVDVRIHDLPLLGAGLTADVELTALGWWSGPDVLGLAVRESRAQLYVFETSVRHRPREGALTFAAGRLVPRVAPGLLVVDGGQVGVRLGSENPIELGLVAGGLPDPWRLEPTTGRWTATGYVSVPRTPLAGALTLGGAARVSFINVRDVGSTAEAEADLWTWWGDHIDIRAGVRADIQRPGSESLALQTARVDVAIRPFPSLEFELAGRMQDNLPALYEGLLSPATFAVPKRRRAHGGVSWRAFERWTVRTQVGASQDVDLKLDRGFARAELVARSLISEETWTVGHQEALGWVDGRTSFARVVAPFGSRMLGLASIAYVEQFAAVAAVPSVAAAPSVGPAARGPGSRAVAARGFLSARPWHALELRLSASARVGIDDDVAPLLTVRAGIVGRL